MHLMWKLSPWQVCENKESYEQVGNSFCLFKMWENDGRMGEFI